MPTNPNKLSQFWQELKRRKVVRVIIVYAAAGFAIIEFVDIVTPLKEQRFNPMLDESIFGDIEPNRIRFAKPKTAKMPKKNTKAKPENFTISTHKNMKPVSEAESDSDSYDSKLVVGAKVNHQRFGRGEVIKIEGSGGDAKAEIKFQKGDTKKLLLRFAKLQIMR